MSDNEYDADEIKLQEHKKIMQDFKVIEMKQCLLYKNHNINKKRFQCRKL